MRPNIDDMTTDEKIDEILTIMRAVSDALEQMGQNPMLKALMPKGLGI